MRNVILIAGARPNFMKIAPLSRALSERGVAWTLVHTGQHYDDVMSDIFFRELGIPQPDMNLGIGPGDRITQMRKIINALVPVLRERRPDAVIVVGDVTSTAAGAIAGVMTDIPVAHVEAGLRSFNWPMPEELNRMIADHHSHFLFVNEPSGVKNLRSEHILEERIHLTGNIMIDTLRAIEPRTDACDIHERLGVEPRRYGILTTHRPETVDDRTILLDLIETLCEVSSRIPLILPIHHRTKSRIEEFEIKLPPSIIVTESLGYIDMLTLTKHAHVVLTDSGGLQEETTVLGIPCLTLRDETERPITVEVGTSEIVGRDREKILDATDRVLRGDWKKGRVPDFWDGKTAERIADILLRS